MRNTLLPDKFDDYLRFCRVQDELYLEKSHSVKVESMHSFYEKYPESSVPRFADKHITLKDIQNFFKKVRMYKRGYETSLKNAKHFDPNKIKDWISSYINFDYAILWLNIVLSILLTIVVFVCIIPNNGTVPYEWWQSIFIYPCCFAGYVLGLYAIEIVAIWIITAIDVIRIAIFAGRHIHKSYFNTTDRLIYEKIKEIQRAQNDYIKTSMDNPLPKIKILKKNYKETKEERLYRLSKEYVAKRNTEIYRYARKSNLKIDYCIETKLKRLGLNQDTWLKVATRLMHIGEIRRDSRMSDDCRELITEEERRYYNLDTGWTYRAKELANALNEFQIPYEEWYLYGEKVIETYKLFDYPDIQEYGFVVDGEAGIDNESGYLITYQHWI